LSLAKVQSLFGPLMLALIELVIWSWSTLVAWCILKVQSKYRYNCWIYFVRKYAYLACSLIRLGIIDGSRSRSFTKTSEWIPKIEPEIKNKTQINQS
jgi:hypothetical protein